jgi:sugar/nucleoside kinase (ribokinase family)
MAYDRVLYTNSLWEDGKGRITKEEFRFGGNVRNALATIAALHVPATYLTTMSEKPEWAIALEDLKKSGISTQYVEFKENSYPAIATVFILNNGERFIAYDDFSLKHLNLPSQQKVDEALSKTKLLLIDSYTAPDGTLEVLKKAISLGIPAVVDAEREGINAGQYMEMIDIAPELVIPLHYGAFLADQTDVELIMKYLWNQHRSTVVLTDGAHGSYFVTDKNCVVQHQPAFKVNTVDTNGTGDVFHGAYAVGRYHGKSIPESIKYATAAAAVVVQLPHGQPRIPSENKIQELLI